MSSAAVLAAALALLCVASALWFVQRGARRAGRTSTERFIDSHIGAAAAGGRGAAMASAAAGAGGARGTAGIAGTGSATARSGATAIAGTGNVAAAGAVGVAPAAMHGSAAAARSPASASSGTASGVAASAAAASAARASGSQRNTGWHARWHIWQTRASNGLHNILSRAGLVHARPPLFIALACALLLSMLASAYGGWPALGAALATSALALYVLVSWRTRARRRRIVRQLPSFLDGIVRLVVLGNSVPAAFQAALQTTEAPLRECLDHVSRMLRSGVEIDRALQHVSELYRVSEFELVGAVLRLSVKYGGRADTMLDRMASFMRDLEQAERELVAMSAETRMSAWVLALLPIAIGGFLIAFNPRYFASMWNDGSGRSLAYCAFGMQAAGVLLLYRLARLRN
jgi:tight adherence protein B